MLDRILFFEENFINDFDKQYKSINDYFNEIGVSLPLKKRQSRLQN
ncbi:MAG: hypothetical protein RBS76_05565 [Acholeplasmatales bacterium]|jgi:hypothetical protein|nr:hypothetical protein [Acholeplasmataceae bacterium]MDY0115931.1 hypothetical protein [Acholeplasmatales bacterium]